MSLLSLLQWMDIGVFLTLLAVILIVTDVVRNKTPQNYPPGPWALPIVGDLFRLDPRRIHLQMAQMAKEYGNIFTVRVSQRFVIINGLKLAREALIQDGVNFVDRPSLPLLVDLVKNKGLIVSSGIAWKQQRRFALSTLRNFGLGKKSLESSILTENVYLNEAIKNEQGQPFDPQLLLNNAVSNIICCLVFGDRFDYSNHDFQTLLKLMNENFHLEGSMWAQMYSVFPWLMRRIPGPHQKIFSNWDILTSFVKLRIQEHKQYLDPSAPRDYIDSFLIEMEKWKDDVEAEFTEENLCYCSLDLFVAGTETTATTLNWGLLYMITYPEIQARVQAEIDQIVGPSRQPSMADKANMPYTDAVIHEIQRMGNILPLNVARMATKDTTVGGYTIPKGTTVIAALNSVLCDETEWETPYTFNPGHFLDSEGKFRRRDAFLPFSLGIRVCLGEQLARMELFLFFTTLLQRFTFSPPPGEEPSLEFNLGLTRCPKPYKLCVVSR